MPLHALRQGGADLRRCWLMHDDASDERCSSRPNPGAVTVASHMRVCALVVSPQCQEDTRLARELEVLSLAADCMCAVRAWEWRPGRAVATGATDEYRKFGAPFSPRHVPWPGVRRLLLESCAKLQLLTSGVNAIK